MNINEKLHQLQHIFAEMGSVMVAYSGGVDSSLLLKVAYDVLGDRAIAVTALSEVSATGEIADAKTFARMIGARHIIIETEELKDESFAQNPADRCYYCKKELFTKLLDLARAENINYVVYGANTDDLGDHRPGMEAAKDLQVRAPMLEVALAKEEVRQLARMLGLSNWDRPALACLASRFPYGIRITKENLSMVDQAEYYLRSLGFKQLRVRHHQDTARIELASQDLVKAVQLNEKIVCRLKELGYKYITLDLQGYRTGSMNEVLPQQKQGGA